MDDQVLQGHCLCKTIRITVSGEPLRKFLCYCPDCQRSAGGPCQAVAVFNAENVSMRDHHHDVDEARAEWTGGQGQDLVSWTHFSPGLSVYTIMGAETASGHPKPKVFCKICGCTIATVPGKWGGKMVVIRPNLLHQGLDAKGMKPAEEWFASHRPEFLPACSDAKQYETVP